jgi:hypothetical protein
MAYCIDSKSAGKDVDAFEEGVRRFQELHPNLDWDISAGQLAGRLHITVITPDNDMRAVRVQPRLDMADAVFIALEQALKSK